MFYFKTAPAPCDPTKIDIDQLKRVAEFKRSVSQEGLYWEYKSHEEFANLLRLHLIRQVQQLHKTQSPAIKEEVLSATDNIEDANDEPGILDFLATADSQLEGAVGALDRMTEAANDFTARLNDRTKELKALGQLGNYDIRLHKQFASKVAVDFNTFAMRISAEIPQYSKCLQGGIEATIQATQTHTDDSNNTHSAEEVSKALAELLDRTKFAESTTQSLIEITQPLPRMTTEFNRAKRSVIQTLDSLRDEICRSQNLIVAAIESLEPPR